MSERGATGIIAGCSHPGAGGGVGRCGGIGIGRRGGRRDRGRLRRQMARDRRHEGDHVRDRQRRARRCWNLRGPLRAQGQEGDPEERGAQMSATFHLCFMHDHSHRSQRFRWRSARRSKWPETITVAIQASPTPIMTACAVRSAQRYEMFDWTVATMIDD